ncbi:MAG TPA: pyridoxamine 5'-phosphate oxidase [Bacteroidales bacterium]|nr:pyridoxamine 5'-phosphate oxidase [Bacteroidales bacterium]
MIPKKYHDLRSEYLHQQLDEQSVMGNPFDQFAVWMDQAVQAEILHPTAMLLATVGRDGQPSCRVVLLKEVNEKGFVFFTHYDSHKGRQLGGNSKVALTFFWKETERQIRIEGSAEKVDEKVSDEYFVSRPYESRLSAAASPQSSVISSRQELEQQREAIRAKYPDGNIPRPKNWGGYLIIPDNIEFWQGRENRLHDRIVYQRTDGGWKIHRLAP